MFKWFGNSKNSVKSSQILICLVGDATDTIDFQQDKTIYQSYQTITEYRAATGTDFLNFVQGKTYDLVHILVSVKADGTIGGVSGIRLLSGLSGAGAKLVLFAHANPVDHYVAAFPQKERKGFVEPSLVLTRDRKGDNFLKFFGSLFQLMATGKTMPMAWVKLAPQHDGPWMKEMPDTIFEANRGQIKFVP